MLYMVGLPALLLGLGFGLRALFRRRKASAENAAAAVDAPSAAPPAEDARELNFTLALLAAGVATAAGEDAAAVLAALKEREIRPAPDTELRNRDGFPVIASRVPDLVLDESELALLQSSMPPPAMVPRALTLMKKAFTPVSDVLRVTAKEAFAEPDAEPAVTAPKPRLIVDLIVPNDWDPTYRRQVTAVANCLLADTGWPDEARVLRTLDIGQCRSALHQIDLFNVEANRSGSLDYYLVLACESRIGDDAIAKLDGRNMLFGSSTPKGMVPGEAATAILVRRPIAGDGSAPKPMALLGRAVLATRGNSIDAAGRAGCVELTAATKTSLEQVPIPADQVTAVFSDIDQHSGRCAECVGVLNDLLPHVDPAEQFIAIGQSLGHLESTGPLLALSLAAEFSAAEEQSALVISALHATERLAVPLRPPAQAASA